MRLPREGGGAGRLGHGAPRGPRGHRKATAARRRCTGQLYRNVRVVRMPTTDLAAAVRPQEDA
ncbi:hypothetical protein [Ornithinimicrobium kibberense]|uniref:hypothetical protein n=1 Tax=Ornithinimicrobium kibberense TaxID=282060 RepID=UPI00361A572A